MKQSFLQAFRTFAYVKGKVASSFLLAMTAFCLDKHPFYHPPSHAFPFY
jgi:hypothetical protein